MSKPVWVYVHWSENNRFKDKELMPFNEFERKCRDAAREVGVGNGYDKTKIKVLFDDGDYFEVRLDLCQNEDTGFKSYCDSMSKWIGSERFYSTYGHDQAIIDEYMKMQEYLNQIEWAA
jgi:hypothetical protein